MQPMVILLGVSIALGAAQSAQAEPGFTTGKRCAVCNKTLGVEVPESTLSADPEFKEHDMFQCCQTCLDKRMDKRAQRTYTEVSQKYKKSSISHNRSLAFRAGRRRFGM